MAVSGMWLLIVFFGIIYALQQGVSSDLFIIMGAIGAVAFVTTQ